MAPVTQNITIAVPTGSIEYGNELCSPPHWTNILIFYLSNYVVHVVTVQMYPGESTYDMSIALISALFFPTSGISRGLNRIVRFAAMQKGTLTRAARAGALCMVVRNSEWKPRPGERLENAIYMPSNIDERTLPAHTRDERQRPKCTDPPTVQSAHSSGSLPCARDLNARAIEAEVRVSGDELSTTPQRLPEAVVDDAKIFVAPWQQEGSSRWDYLDSAAHADLGITRKVAGRVILKPGYMLAFVPRDALVEGLDSPEKEPETRSWRRVWTSHWHLWPATRKLPTSSSNGTGNRKDLEIKESTILVSYSAVTGIAAVAQLLFGLSTVYASTGAQINRYGFAAFGLTVIPYTIMSLVNLVATIATPAYSAVYLVESEIMKEAQSRGAEFSGTVGRLVTDQTPANFTRGMGRTVSVHQNGVVDWKESRGTTETPSSGSVHRVSGDQSVPDRSQTTTETTALVPVFLGSSDKELDIIPYHNPHDLETSHTSSDASLYIPGHPQYKRKQRWYCDANNNIRGCIGSSLSAQANASNITLLSTIMTGSASLLPIGLLSRFRKAQATLAEQVITMLWLAFGIWIGVSLQDPGYVYNDLRRSAWPMMPPNKAVKAEKNELNPGSLRVALILFYSAPAIAGFVEVGLMYSKFGTCVQLYHGSS